MAYTELHTAALRLVHVTHPTDRDMDYLSREFHLASDDTEAVLGVNEKNSVLQRPGYRRLTVQWPSPSHRGVMLTDVHCFVGPDWLVVIDHGNFTAAVELVKELQSLPAERLWEDQPMMVAYELWRRAIRELQQFDRALAPAHYHSMIQTRARLGDALQSYINAATDEPTVVKGFNFLAFTLRHANPVGVRAPIASTQLPFTARGYAAASVAVAIVTLLVVSRTL